MLKINFFNDTTFIERIRANDRKVLGEIFLKYEKLVATFVKKHQGSAEDAEDILQESIIVLWRQVLKPDFSLTSKLGTYLLAIAKNKWFAELRKRKQTTDLSDEYRLSDNNPSFLENILEDEEINIIENALNKLQKICKEILLLFYFEERSMRQIAALLNLAGPDVAKAKKYQCKKALQKILLRQIAGR